MSKLPDELLLERFRSGDELALEALFERYETSLFQFLLGLLRNHHQAEDALQETFIKALQHHRRVQAESFRSWLFTVAYREAMGIRRRVKRDAIPMDEPLLTFMDPNPCGQIIAEQKDQAGRLRSLLDQLPKVQRDVIQARIYDGKRYREIAADLGCPLNTALARMHEGLKRLRTLWEEQHA